MNFHNWKKLDYLNPLRIAAGSPVERVVEVWEDPHEEGRVGGLEVVPDHVEDGEHNVEAVRQVQADQQLVKHVPHLRPEMETQFSMSHHLFPNNIGKHR